MRYLSITYALLLTLVCLACQKDDDITPGTDPDTEITTPTPNPIPDNVPFGARIDGQVFVPTAPTAVLFTDRIAVSGTSNNSQLAINFFLAKDIKVGTYSFTYFGAVSGGYAPNSESLWRAERGTLVVTKHDIQTKRIEGTFDFTAENPQNANQKASVTDGRFALSY